MSKVVKQQNLKPLKTVVNQNNEKNKPPISCVSEWMNLAPNSAGEFALPTDRQLVMSWVQCKDCLGGLSSYQVVSEGSLSMLIENLLETERHVRVCYL